MMRSFPRSRTAAAGAGVLAGGVIVNKIPTDLALIDFDVSDLLSLVLATVFSLTAIRRWLRQYEERTKADVRLLAEQHRLRSEELDRREQEVARRERYLERCEDTYNLRMRSLAHNLDTAQNRLAKMTARHEALTGDYNEVRRDYNALIEHVLREGHDRFTARTEGVYKPFTADMPHRGDEHRRSLPTVPVAFLRPREHHPSA